ncbi:MAG: M64 family metallopeptidase [Bacteroidota bacterium]|nr:M64 family metallopeptidase [Bacteroidota bacterium]
MKQLYKSLLITLLILIAAPNGMFSQTYTVDTILYQGDVDYPINLVFLGDGFLESELQDFRDIAEEYTDLLFTVDPFERFNSFFNAFSISVPSNVSGAATDPDNLIDNYFGSTFGYAGIDRLLVPTDNTAITTVLANNFPEYDQVFMLVNSDTYGGSGGWVATASLHEDSPDIALHELGHSFADLADEYWAGIQYAREAINMTQETDLEQLKWRNWYGDYDIGLYSHAENTSWYRPHQNCIMRYLGEPFCAVCREGVIEALYAKASPLKEYEPGTTTFEMTADSVLFKLDLNHPEPNSLESLWYLNDAMIGAGMDSISILKSELNGGLNTVKATVTDTSYQLRPFDDASYYHKVEIEWNVGLSTVGTEQQIKILNHSAIRIYPNPVYDMLNVKILDQVGEAEIELYDSRGREIQSLISNYYDTHVLDMSSLDAGIYMIKISLDGKYLSSRIIIKH